MKRNVVVVMVLALCMTISASTLISCSSGGDGGGNGGGQGEGGVPSAPTNVSILVGAGQVTLSWDPVPGAVSYDLYWATSPGVTFSSIEIEGVTSPYVLTGLMNGTQCYCAVAAVNAAGEGPLSVEVWATP